jgi:hypothetical protein
MEKNWEVPPRTPFWLFGKINLVRQIYLGRYTLFGKDLNFGGEME